MKVGDVVQIKDKEEIKRLRQRDGHIGTLYFNRAMFKFCGKKGTISKVISHASGIDNYEILEFEKRDGGRWRWREEMFVSKKLDSIMTNLKGFKEYDENLI
jgi:hypothetical protein